MDCLRDKPLPLEYSSLRKLNILTFEEGRQNVISLGNNMFDTVTNLNISEINLAGLNLRIIGQHTFSKLRMLRKIDLSNNPDLAIHLTDISSSLKKMSIRVLNLNNVGIVNSLHSVTYTLKRFCSLPLEELTLDNNYFYIGDLKPIFSTCFPKLKILTLSNNYLSLAFEVVTDIMNLKNLIQFNISNQMTLQSSNSHMNHHSETMVHRLKRSAHLCETGMACPYVIPRKMEWIDISYNGVHIANIPELVLLRNTSLNYLKASYCGIRTIVYPMYCPWNVVPKIEILDLRNNHLQCISF